jgi:hypothetical protein
VKKVELNGELFKAREDDLRDTNKRMWYEKSNKAKEQVCPSFTLLLQFLVIIACRQSPS